MDLIVQPMQHLLSINVFNKCCTLNNGYCNCADNFDLGEWCKDVNNVEILKFLFWEGGVNMR